MLKKRLNDEIHQLLVDIRRIGPTYPYPCPKVLFGELFVDDQVEQYYEALVGTLKSAKKRNLIHFNGQMLLKGVHDHVVIAVCEEGVERDHEEKKELTTLPRKPLRIWTPPPTPNQCKVVTVPRSASNSTSSGFTPRYSSQQTPVSVTRRWTPPPKSPVLSTSTMKQPTSIPVTPDSHTKTWRNSTTTWRGNQSIPVTPDVSIPAQSKITTTNPTFSSNVVTPSNERYDDQSKIGCVDHISPSSDGKQSDKYSSRSHSEPDMLFRPSPRSVLSAEVSNQVQDEVHELVMDLRRLGAGSLSVKFGTLFDDDIVQNKYEALVGTLRSAKRQGLIHFSGQMLLKGMHDNVVISVLEQ
jgi:Costars